MEHTSDSLRRVRKGKIPLVTQSAAESNQSVAAKGNPLIGSDPLGESLNLAKPQRPEFIRRHLRIFEQVYGRSPAGTESSPPSSAQPPDCDGVAQDDSCYYYSSAAFVTAADGGGMTISVDRPAYVGTGGSGHTLNEISLQGGVGNGNIVELGWSVSDRYSDNNPHIFVFHWNNWAPLVTTDAVGSSGVILIIPEWTWDPLSARTSISATSFTKAIGGRGLTTNGWDIFQAPSGTVNLRRRR